MEGAYLKYNTNGGWVNPIVSQYSDTTQAFSHYTWVKSGKQLVVCDLQGVTKGDKIFLTDPEIHSNDYMFCNPKEEAIILVHQESKSFLKAIDATLYVKR